MDSKNGEKKTKDIQKPNPGFSPLDSTDITGLCQNLVSAVILDAVPLSANWQQAVREGTVGLSLHR